MYQNILIVCRYKRKSPFNPPLQPHPADHQLLLKKQTTAQHRLQGNLRRNTYTQI